jgi:tetratricopeptide (TPR) repeat protein
VPNESARKRLFDIAFDPKTIAGLLAAAVTGALAIAFFVFGLQDKLPDWVKQRITPTNQWPLLGATAAVVTLLLWLVFLLVLVLFERRRHPDGRPTPGKVAIYVAELRGDNGGGLHREHVLYSLRQQLGDCVQILCAGLQLGGNKTGNPDYDALSANRKGRRFLNQGRHKGDLLIWGQVLKDEKLVELRFTSPAHDGAEQKRFNLTEKLLLAPDFGPEMAAALATIAAQLALPAVNPGRFVANVLQPVAKKLGGIAANLPVGMDSEQRGLLLHCYAATEETIGEQTGSSQALGRAIAAYREALKGRTREKVPLDWATTQVGLGIALARLGERESSPERLEEAVAAYREALKEYTRAKAPLDWAMTQNNLGIVFRVLGEREGGTERLEAAVAAFREALKEWTREKVPLQWAVTQNNLGNALGLLGERENGTERLEEAVAAYREALVERTRERVPLEWAGTQNNLGNVLGLLGERESGTGRLEEAVAAYREALVELTRGKVPLDWAMTQNNLGSALFTLGERESGTERLEEAVAACREALKERTREKVPLQWATTQNNLGAALESLGKLDEAAEAYRMALEVFTPENHLPRYQMTARNLARMLEKLDAAQVAE